MFYAGGSHSETKTWLTKAKNRKIVTKEFHDEQMQKLERLGVKMKNYIKVLEKQTK